MIYRFGPFELDERAAELRRGGERVAVQPKPLALLALLIRERERVVSQDELLEALWPGTAVTSGSLTRAVSGARRAIGDTHKGTWLRSVPRLGYRFVGDVLELGGETTQPAPSKAAARGASDAWRAAETKSATPPATPRSANVANVFVGREEALEKLHHSWDLARSSPGRIVLVSGAAGVGKTRLAEVFGAQATARGTLVVFGRSREGEGVPAFWLWSQVLRELDQAGLAEAGGHFEGLLADAGSSADAEDAERRFLFFDAVARALVQASRARPLILVLEDLQWAQSPALRLLEHVAFELGDARLLIVGTIRSERRERGHPVDRCLSILMRHAHCESIELRGLSRAAIRSLLEEVIGRPPPAELTSELFARTEGVPLFVREAVRLLAERGELKRPERIRRQGIALPGHVIDLIRRSLEGLSADCAELVAAGSVLGREFTLGNVASVAGIDRDAAIDLLEEAVAAGVLEEVPGVAATCRFSHALFQEAAYSALQAGHRTRLHARAAELFETRHAENPVPVIAELAHHHHQSIAIGDPERAYACAVAAAEEASRLLAHEQAAMHYEQAVDALDHLQTADPARRLATLIDLGEAHRRAGDRARRREVSLQAMDDARALGRDRDFALAVIRFCDVNEWSPEDEAANRAVDEALRGTPPDDVVLRARLKARQAYLGIRHESARGLAREAVELARRSADPETLQEVLYVLLYSLAGPDHFDERRALRTELSAAANRVRSRDSAAIASLDIACDHLTLGDAEGATRVREEIRTLAGERPSLAIRWHTQVFDTGRKLLEGSLDGIDELANDALLVGKRIDHPYAQACFNGQRMQLHRYRRQFDAIDALFGRARQSSVGANHWALAVLARNAVRLGEDARAREHWADLARHDFHDIGRGIRWIGTLLELAHLCADLEDGKRAASLIEMLTPAEHLHGVLPVPILYSGPASHALARLHEIRGASDVAIQYYEEALEQAGQMGARPVEARIRLDLAGAIARRGDAARAAALEREGQQIADAIGCHL
jgi:DNA-binding winged helix-turn-helix (wHTH) protein/tetratricopeptide (TPR) repeat protein